MFNEKLMKLYVDVKKADVEDKDPVMKEYENLVYFPNEEIAKKKKPDKWGFAYARRFHKLSLMDFDPRIKKFLDDHMPMFWDALRTPITEGSIPRTTIHIIHDIDKKLPIKRDRESKLQFIPIEEFPKINPKFSHYRKKGVTYCVYKYDEENIVEIPLMEGVWNKGGDFRLVLKGLFNEKYIQAEIPLNDHDICVKDYNIGKEYMKRVGEEDLSGIEVFSDLVDVINSRDVDMNQGLITASGVIYAIEAEHAIKSGYVRPIGADQGVFGRGAFYTSKYNPKTKKIENIKIFKPRVAYERAFKFVIEGKARGFILDDNNTQLFMGIFLMVSICRMIGKKNCAEKIEKLYYILNTLEITDQFRYVFKHLMNLECNDVFDLLENGHRLFPFFELEVKGQDDQVAQWLILKTNRWFRNEFREMYHLYSDKFIECLNIDPLAKENIYTLDNFKSDPELINRINEWLPGFLERCRKRNIIEGSMLVQ